MTTFPAGWALIRLGDVAETRLGKMLDKATWNGRRSMPYLRNANVQWGRIDSADLLTMEVSEDEVDRFSLRTGDLLVCEGGEIGRAAIWSGPDHVMAFQKALHRVRSTEKLDVRFLEYFMRRAAQEGILARFATGSTIKHLPQEKLRSLEVPLPPPGEQRRLVDLLDDHFSRLDAADARLKTAERRLESYRRSSLDDLLSVGTIGTTHLGALVERVEAGRSFGGSAPEATGDEWGVIRVSAMTWGEFRPQNNKAVDAARIDPRHEIQPGDVLVSRANTSEYVGAPVLVRETPPRRLLSDKSMRLIPRQGVDSEWLVMALAATATRRQISALATGTSESMRNISQARLLSVQVPVPPRSGQSSAVAQYADTQRSAQRVQGEIARNLSRSRGLRRGLLEAAFTGRLTGKSLDMEIAEELADSRGAMA